MTMATLSLVNGSEQWWNHRDNGKHPETMGAFY